MSNTVHPPSSIFTREQSKAKTLKFVLLLCPVLWLLSCNSGDKEVSPYSEVLSRAPFSAITDSIRHDPGNDELYFRRAVLLNKNDLPEPSLADFQKAWSLKRNEKYAVAVARAWLEKRPDSAIVFINSALNDLPQSYLLRLSLARTYDKTDRINEAIGVCSDILKSVPEMTDVWILESQLYDRKGDSISSLNAMEQAHFLQPDNFDIASELAYKYAQNKNAKAISLCDSLITRDSLHLFEQPYYVKGIYYSNVNDKVKAMHFFDETIKRNHNYMSAYVEKGKILLDQKKINDAFNTFRLANTIKPAYPDAWYWMAVCQEQLGLKEDAQLNYQKAYSLDKTFTAARNAAERLSK